MGIRKFRYGVLATVSAAALMILIERGVAADLPDCEEDDHWWGAIEGQYLLYGGDSAKYGFEGIDPPVHRLKPDDGWGVGGEIGFQPACSPWSFLGRIRYGEGKDDDDAFITIDGGVVIGVAEADHREKHVIADLEIGRDVGLGALGDGSKLRLFAGLRFAHLKGDGSLSWQIGGTGFRDADLKRTFTGIGPRIGFDATMPLAEQVSLDIGAAGALLFGKQKFKADGSYGSAYFVSEIDDKRSKSVIVPNLEASAAFGWLITDNAKFSLGYRADAYFDVYDNGLIFGRRDEGDRILHGPFIKFTIGSGGDRG